MTRGDQRDRARAKNLAKKAAEGKKPEGSFAQRKERDAAAMREKNARAQAKLAAGDQPLPKK